MLLKSFLTSWINKPPVNAKNYGSNLSSLQILRGIAAISVVYLHIGALPSFGSFGVDIFFVISGFVMAMIVVNGQTAKTFVFSRITRIVPLYWLITTGLLALVAIKPELFKDTTANLREYFESILFIPYNNGHRGLLPLLAVGWTLNYEMFFYFSIWISMLVSRRFFIPTTSFIIFVFYLLADKQYGGAVFSSFFGNTIIFEFLFGIIVFQLHTKWQLSNTTSLTLIVISVLSYVFMAVAESNNVTINRLLINGIPSAILVFSMLKLEEQLNRLNFDKKLWAYSILVRTGDASYAIYLIHLFIVVGFVKIAYQKLHLINPYSPLGVAIILFSSLLAGQLLYVFVDKPLIKYFKYKFRLSSLISAKSCVPIKME